LFALTLLRTLTLTRLLQRTLTLTLLGLLSFLALTLLRTLFFLGALLLSLALLGVLFLLALTLTLRRLLALAERLRADRRRRRCREQSCQRSQLALRLGRARRHHLSESNVERGCDPLRVERPRACEQLLRPRFVTRAAREMRERVKP